MKKKKRTDRITRHQINERLTNWYMINFCWGVAGIVALTAIYHGYRNAATILAMQPLMWILTGVFAVGAIVVFALGKTGVIKNERRAKNYGIFLGVCALVGLWLALYNKIRPIMERFARFILGNPTLTVSSYWNVWIPMIAIIIYLAGAFIYYAVKVSRK